jgi:hypothetical protein
MDSDTLLKLADASGDPVYLRAEWIVAVYPYWFDNDPDENRYITVELSRNLEGYENGIVRLDYECGLSLMRYLDGEAIDLTTLPDSAVRATLNQQIKV